MGVIADTVLAEGGEVIGVMPRALFPQEIAHRGVTTFYEVKNMHERKALLADLADGFVTLPGGLGTYDELFEILTWAQLGIHQKPVGLLNVLGYFDPLLALLHQTMTEGFMLPSHVELLLHKEDPTDLLDCLAAYVPTPLQSKWTDPPVR
jgi:cytokinin riboside 5'-monophosphate phosphoribohydrolase